jgi:putative tryptophan/tyrosine transport system substrate-binding protein
MKRREFVKVIVGSGLAWPLAARAQQPERMRRIGVLANAEANDPEWKRQIAAFLEHEGLGMGKRAEQPFGILFHRR